MWLVLKLMKKPLFQWHVIWADKRSLLLCGLAGFIMCISWYAFTWSLTHDDVLAASLGYFINPLFAISFGMLCLKERLTKMQLTALLLAICGIAIQVIYYGTLPWLSLIMGCFFAIYGLCKKFIRFDALTSVALEALLLVPFAAAYLLWEIYHGHCIALQSGTFSLFMYIGSAPVTIIPLVLFALALKSTNLSTVALMQYIEPSIQFLLAIFFFGEAFNDIKAISFAVIWLGLILCVFEKLQQNRRFNIIHDHK